MKAFVVTRYGPDGLEPAEIPTPTPGERDVLVDIRAASINPLDKMISNGEFKQLIKYKPPFVLGHDLSGVITRVGPGVRGFKVGDPPLSSFPTRPTNYIGATTQLFEGTPGLRQWPRSLSTGLAERHPVT